MNKGLAIGIGIAIVIGGIGIAAISSLVSLAPPSTDSGSGVGTMDTAEVSVRNATEQEDFPPNVEVSAKEGIGISTDQP